MSRSSLARIAAWIPLVVTVCAEGGFIALSAAGCGLADPVNHLPTFIAGGGFALLSLLIIYHRPTNRIGWLAALISVSASVMPVSLRYADCMVTGEGALPAAEMVSWIAYVMPWVVVFALFIALPLLFPDGHFLSPGWRRFAAFTCGLLALLGFLIATLPGPLLYNGIGVVSPYDNPLALPLLPEEAGPTLDRAINAALVVPALAAIVSLVQRWRRSTGDTRQQLKWFAYFLATAVSVQMFIELYGSLVDPGVFTALGGFPYTVVVMVVFAGFPLTVGIAVFKYRLYDIDIIIRRTLLYTALTALLALVYFGSVVTLQNIAQALTGEAGESPLIVVASTLLIAALVGPLRRKLQNSIDRRFYRQKYDAQQVLARFAQRARDEVELERLTAELVGVVAETMQPEGVSIWLVAGETTHGRGAAP